MRQDADNVSKKDSIFRPPKNFKPKIILNLCKEPRIYALEYHRLYPEADIFNGMYGNENFLIDSNSLAYHDNIKIELIDLDSFFLDEFIYTNFLDDQVIDFIRLDLEGKEKDIFKTQGNWPSHTRYLKSRLTNYNYMEAKRDLNALGFDSWASFDGINYYVIGENINV